MSHPTGNQALAVAGGPALDRSAGELALIQREDSERKAAIVAAHHFPRDEAQAYTRLMKACDRPSLAKRGEYRFTRGGSKVEGPSVYLAREAARCWGNVHYGLRIVSVDDDQVHVRGYAWDLETNAYAESEDRFARLIQRKNGNGTQWVSPDERDLRELINRRGAICVRNAILQVLPSDVVEDAQARCAATLKKVAKKELELNRDDTIRNIVLGFDAFGVTSEMLVRHLGHDLSLINADELADLRKIYTSIDEGNTRVAEHFATAYAQSGTTTGGAQDLTERIKRQRIARAKELLGSHVFSPEERAPLAAELDAGPTDKRVAEMHEYLEAEVTKRLERQAADEREEEERQRSEKPATNGRSRSKAGRS